MAFSAINHLLPFYVKHNNSIPRKAAIDYIKPFITTLARIMPATGGTKDTLPGV